jgi:hypothetical protein
VALERIQVVLPQLFGTLLLVHSTAVIPVLLISGQVPHFQGYLTVTVEVDPFGFDRIRLHFQNPGDCV